MKNTTYDAIFKGFQGNGSSKIDCQLVRSVNADFYDSLSRGDKCRVGRGVSTMINKSDDPILERGVKKGSTNTYHIAQTTEADVP